VLFGDRAVGWLAAAQHWLARNQRQATFYSVAFLGALLAVDGVLTLVV
jgi:hypothetical protein